MDQLRITSIQLSLVWENIPKNLENFQKKIESIKEETDIMVLPEMFSTGFIMSPAKLSEKMNGKTVAWMKKMSESKNVLLIGSLIIEENNKFTNRLLAVHPNGDIDYYDKRHLFALGGENKNYAQGQKKLIINYKSWKIKTLICYDLRFPVWSRNQDDYDVAVYVANWPASRSFHWKILLQARAIENQAYIVGVNRIGDDGNGVHHSGDSCVFDPSGHNLSSMNPDEESTETVILEKEKLQNIRKSFPFSADRDQFTIC